MSNNGITLYNNLFSSIISDIKSYSGRDPLLPWLRGLRKMKEALPSELLKEKLPRFLQKCSETFLTDRRYSNDLRYLRVWLQLMDYVEDPKAVLRTMEANHIGMKKSLFYQAYALYYEKMKKFDAAEKIYHLGVQNLAEPPDELQKSYEQFLHRMERHRRKRVQHQGGKILPNQEKGKSLDGNSLMNKQQAAFNHHKESFPEAPAKFFNIENIMAEKSNNVALVNDQLVRKVLVSDSGVNTCFGDVKVNQDENKRLPSEDTVVVKFVDTALVGKSNTEDARHHGLVEPTVNTKEAMNTINNMFREPLEPSIAGKRPNRKQSKTINSLTNGFMVFTDENSENEVGSSHQSKNPSFMQSDAKQPLDEPFEIFIDCNETADKERVNENVHSEGLKDRNPRKAHQAGLREDTVVYRFVGSAISDGPWVENVWHHGLVEPTINFKEAMNDINSMFGKPIEYTRKSRRNKQDKLPNGKNDCGEFLILPDDELDNQKAEADKNSGFEKPLTFGTKSSPRKQDKAPDVIDNNSGFLILPDDEVDNHQNSSLPSSSTENGNDLFEQTLCTKEAMAEINKLFAMPMDF